MVYTVPGSNRLSGRYKGPDPVMGYFARLMAMTAGTYEISDMLWLTCGNRVVLSTRNHATIGERSLVWDEATLFDFLDGVKKRIDLFQAEQAKVDGFLSTASA